MSKVEGKLVAAVRGAQSLHELCEALNAASRYCRAQTDVQPNGCGLLYLGIDVEGLLMTWRKKDED